MRVFLKYMCTSVETPILVASFQNDEVGLCANVRDFHECHEFEVAVVDAFSGDLIISRQFTTKEAALNMAEILTAAWKPTEPFAPRAAA